MTVIAEKKPSVGPGYFFNQPGFFTYFIVASYFVMEKNAIIDATVIPYNDDFEELQESKTQASDYSGDYFLDPIIMHHIMSTQEFYKTFDFKSVKFDDQASRFHFTKQFDDPKDATVFKNKLNDFLRSFVKEEVKIPENVFERVKEAIENKRDEFEADKVDFQFDGFRVTFIGKREDVVLKKRSIEAAIISEEAKFISADVIVDDPNKLKFLNFINYFNNILTEFPGVQFHGIDGTSGKLSLVGTTEKTNNVQLKIDQDLVKISEIDVKTSVHQIDLLQRTQCKIVNDELKKDDAMLLLINVEGAVGAKALQAKIMTLTKLDNTEVILKSNVTNIK